MCKIDATPEEEQEYLNYHTYEDVLNNLTSGLEMVNNFVCPYPKGSVVLISGAMAAFDKGILDFLNKLNESSPNLNMVMLSEVTAQYRRYTKEHLSFPYLFTPHLLAKEMVIRKMELPEKPEVKQLIDKKIYLKEAVQNQNGRYPDLGHGYAETWVYYAYVFIVAVLDKIRPRMVILWNEFYAFHHVFCGICKEKQIELRFMEFGCLPGTFCIEKKGQQGESNPARFPEDFRSLPVTIGEITEASDVIDFLRISCMNRNPQPMMMFRSELLHYWKPGQKIVTYFGQNLYESGMYPYTSLSQEFHSPIFQTDIEALYYLQELCCKNGWNLIYKPHPIIHNLGLDKREEISECDVLDDVNINSLIDFTDVSVTIVSQCAYISLIREKPVVMLGYTQLKRKGCAYEAFNKEEIEKKIKIALVKGYTEKQRKHFKKHCAQLLKFYLLDDCTERTLRFGRNIMDIDM